MKKSLQCRIQCDLGKQSQVFFSSLKPEKVTVVANIMSGAVKTVHTTDNSYCDETF